MSVRHRSAAAPVPPAASAERDSGPSDRRGEAARVRASRIRSGEALRLSPAEFAPQLSGYLAGGFKQDTVVLREIIVTFPRATARFDVTEYWMPQNGRYHFTALHALIGVSQVGIVLASSAHGLVAKPGEIYMRDFTIVCRREINRTRGLVLCCRLARQQETPEAVLYQLEYDYCRGAFTGSLRCLFPLVTPASTETP